MLTRELVEEIRCLLFAGNCSQRAIARRLGVSRGAVQRVARGKYRLYAPLKSSANEEFQPPHGPRLRCPGCGGKVKMPCLACYLRNRKGIIPCNILR
jgi:hypothetical protein